MKLWKAERNNDKLTSLCDISQYYSHDKSNWLYFLVSRREALYVCAYSISMLTLTKSCQKYVPQASNTCTLEKADLDLLKLPKSTSNFHTQVMLNYNELKTLFAQLEIVSPHTVKNLNHKLFWIWMFLFYTSTTIKCDKLYIWSSTFETCV